MAPVVILANPAPVVLKEYLPLRITKTEKVYAHSQAKLIVRFIHCFT